MDERQRGAEEELRQRREELKNRREDAERRSREAGTTAEYHVRQADRIHDRVVRRELEGRSKLRDKAADLYRNRREYKQAKKAREEREAAEGELNSIYQEELRLRTDEANHERRNFAAESREEAGQIHKRIAEQYPAYAQGSGLGHKVEDPNEMHKVEAYARDYAQIRQREYEYVRQQTARGVEESNAQKQASRRTLRDYGLDEHIAHYPDYGPDDQDEEARRQDIARRTGVEIEDRDADDDQGEDGRDEGLGY